jgi:hypothetical protein
MKIIETDLRTKSLDRYVDVLIGAIAQARNILLAGNLIAFVIIGSLFNAIWSWNLAQERRRAELVTFAAEVETEQLTHATMREAVDRVLSRPQWSDKSWIQAAIGDPGNDKDMSYLQRMPDGKALREMCEKELLMHVEREKSLDTMHLPFLGVEFAASDRTVVGGMALALVAVWLVGSFRRQQSVLDEFIKHPGCTGDAFQLNEEYGHGEQLYVHKSVSSSPAFSHSERWLLVVTKWFLFLVPPATIALSLLYYMYFGIHFRIITPGRTIVEMLIASVTTALWVTALLANARSEATLDGWGEVLAATVRARTPDPDEVATGSLSGDDAR